MSNLFQPIEDGLRGRAARLLSYHNILPAPLDDQRCRVWSIVKLFEYGGHIVTATIDRTNKVYATTSIALQPEGIPLDTYEWIEDWFKRPDGGVRICDYEIRSEDLTVGALIEMLQKAHPEAGIESIRLKGSSNMVFAEVQESDENPSGMLLIGD
ncbi:hypothetical protein GR28A_00077 [Vibrio phage vB_VcorM_GR28A]|nr:hypothetical protein GR28A_00077 [Vibrio phage vB_VcorM_GR28A]